MMMQESGGGDDEIRSRVRRLSLLFLEGRVWLLLVFHVKNLCVLRL
jgi:hypothetical protein